MSVRSMHRRPRLAGVALLLIAAAIGRVVAGQAASPPLFTRALRAAPWSATLDQNTGRLFVVNRSLGAGFTAYSFASAASYSFAINGNIGSIYNSRPTPSADTISLFSADGTSFVRSVPVGGDPGTAAVDPQHGLVYVSSEDDDTVGVFDAHTAALLHTIRVGTRPDALAVSASTGRAFVVNAGDGTVSVIDTGSRRVLRTVNVPTAVDAAGVAVDARVQRVFLAAAGALSILHARSGALMKTIALETRGGPAAARSGAGNLPMMTSVVVDEQAGRVYVLDAGALTMVDAARDRVLRRVHVGVDATALALDPRSGRLLLTRMGRPGPAGPVAAAGRLEVRNPRTGAVLRSIALGLAPIAVAVDERTDRAVVVDSGGERSLPRPWAWLPDGLRRWLPGALRQGASIRVEPPSVIVLNMAKL